MNDCLWFWIGVCECPSLCCDKYLSVNSKEGNEMRQRYELDVAEAIKPVRERYKALAALEEVKE